MAGTGKVTDESLEVDAYEAVHSEFGHGAIKSLELKNFMTHSHLILRPSARGNLIIGPNGSGKSSVVCAIILGLGGSIRTMDRATDLSGFVKRDTTTATITLHLHNAHTGGDTVIRRTIDTDRKSSFFMGKAAVALASVTKQKVQETVQQLGIFVDNNCQVLPQEAISKFVNAHRRDLLDQMEGSILGGSLLKQHEELRAMQRVITAGDVALKELTKQRKRAFEEMETLQEEMNRSEEGVELAAQMERLNVLKPWIETQAAAARVKNLEEAIEQQTKRLHPAEEVDALQASATDLKAQCSAHKRVALAATSVLKQRRAKQAALAKDLRAAVTDIRTMKAALQVLVDGKDSRQRTITKATKALRKTEARLARCLNGRTQEELNAQRAAASQAELAAKANVASARQVLHQQAAVLVEVRGAAANLAQRIEKAAPSRGKRRQAFLRHASVLKHSKGFHALFTKLAQQAVTDFSDPLPCIVDPATPLAARALGARLSFQQATAMIVGTEQAMSSVESAAAQSHVRITSFLFQGDAAGAAAGAAGGGIRLNAAPPELRPELEKAGVEGSLLEALEAPLPALAFLEQLGIGKTLLAPSMRPDQACELLQTHRLAGFTVVCSEHLVSCQRGRISGVYSTIVRDIGQEPSLFSVDSDKQHTLQLKQELEEAQRQVQAQTAVVEEAKAEVEACQAAYTAAVQARAPLVQVLKQVLTFKAKMNELLSKIERAKLSRDDEKWQANVADATRKYRQAIVKSMRLYQALAECAQQGQEDDRQATQANLYQTLLSKTAQAAEAKLTRMQEETAEAASAIAGLKLRAAKAATQRKQLFKAAKSQTGLGPKRDQAAYEAMRTEIFKMMEGLHPSELDEKAVPRWQAAMEKVQGRLLVAIGDTSIPQRLAAAQTLVAGLDQKLRDAYEEEESGRAKFHSALKAWKSRLEQQVAVLQQRFAGDCAALGAVGSIKLVDGGYDCTQYGLELQTAWHGQEVGSSAAAQQSGGEKSVTTILFLLAIQHTSPCPFRLIDEINQGMDSKNERRVLELVARSTAPTALECAKLGLPSTPPGPSRKRVRPQAAAAPPLSAHEAARADPGHQYFILTPKLLPDLDFPDHVRIHTMFNGSFVSRTAASCIDLGVILSKRRAKLEEGGAQPPPLVVMEEDSVPVAAASLGSVPVASSSAHAGPGEESDGF